MIRVEGSYYIDERLVKYTYINSRYIMFVCSIISYTLNNIAPQIYSVIFGSFIYAYTAYIYTIIAAKPFRILFAKIKIRNFIFAVECVRGCVRITYI